MNRTGLLRHLQYLDFRSTTIRTTISNRKTQKGVVPTGALFAVGSFPRIRSHTWSQHLNVNNWPVSTTEARHYQAQDIHRVSTKNHKRILEALLNFRQALPRRWVSLPNDEYHSWWSYLISGFQSWSEDWTTWSKKLICYKFSFNFDQLIEHEHAHAAFTEPPCYLLLPFDLSLSYQADVSHSALSFLQYMKHLLREAA